MQAYVMQEMTWPEVKDALQEVRVAVIPVGSHEQHGPHLAMSADIASAESFGRSLVEAVRPRALLAPPLPYGVSIHHMPFPGTLTLNPETFVQVLIEVAQSFQDHGLERLFVVNGHGGNQAALGIASARMRRELGVRMAYTLWPMVGGASVRDEVKGRRVGHACVLETSMLLHLRPDLVRTDRLAEGLLRPPLYGEPTPPGIDGFVYWNELTENGAFEGAPDARAEIGEKLTRASLERVVGFVRRFAEAELDA